MSSKYWTNFDLLHMHDSMGGLQVICMKCGGEKQKHLEYNLFSLSPSSPPWEGLSHPSSCLMEMISGGDEQ